jgi:hypothetical protein
MTHRPLENIDLQSDPAARRYFKEEVVAVTFALATGEVMSLEGLNRHVAGDAIVTAATGERWVVSVDRFHDKYEPVAPTRVNEDGMYQAKVVFVLAKQMRAHFSIERKSGGDTLHGAAGDWLMQYAPGEYGITKQERFARVYRQAR